MAMSDALPNVLEDGDLLIEILLRVGSPTTLVRAAIVCKRWYHHASDPRFLHRFHELNPPRLLGFYFQAMRAHTAPRFIPMLPQPAELASVIRHESFSLESYHNSFVMDCRNGRVLIWYNSGTYQALQVQSFLRAGRGMAIIPELPRYNDGSYCAYSRILSDEKGKGLSYLYLLVQLNWESMESTVRVHVLQDGVWSMRTSVACQLSHPRSKIYPVAIQNKIYIGSLTYIIVLDLMSSCLSTIQLPKGVYFGDRRTVLSRTDDSSGVYLIHVTELRLHIWLHNSDNWLSVGIICLREKFSNLRMLDRTFDDDGTADVHIRGVGDNAAFVFLTMGRCVLFVDIKCGTLRKVHDMTNDDISINDIYPFMTIWPPTFPELKNDPARKVM
ncbi:uncharacterized protein [Triticum aestivum]|uniref:uncharacterized protein n=1 Tax=Triticum aestivum TaxID=4565 RepID=UPI001D02DCE0|nr:uncharacterized protein LOC123140694 [Triticum aestivum]